MTGIQRHGHLMNVEIGQIWVRYNNKYEDVRLILTKNHANHTDLILWWTHVNLMTGNQNWSLTGEYSEVYGVWKLL